MTSHPIYGLLNRNVTPSPQVQWPGSCVHSGQPFPDSIKEATELKDTKNKNGGAESLTTGTMATTVFNSGLARWRGQPLLKASCKQLRKKRTLASDRNAGQTAGHVHKEQMKRTPAGRSAGIKSVPLHRGDTLTEPEEGDQDQRQWKETLDNWAWWNKTVWQVLSCHLGNNLQYIQGYIKDTTARTRTEYGKCPVLYPFKSQLKIRCVFESKLKTQQITFKDFLKSSFICPCKTWAQMAGVWQQLT